MIKSGINLLKNTQSPALKPKAQLLFITRLSLCSELPWAEKLRSTYQYL